MTPPGRSASSGNLKLCAHEFAISGIDVSDYDHGTQWSEVKSDGKKFSFIKATEGMDFESSTFARDWSASPKAGLVRGAYHFFRPEDDPTRQADFYLSKVGKLGSSDLPAMLDWEVRDGVSASAQIKNAKAWLAIVEKATGKVPIIYTNPSFWNELGNPAGFERYPLFIADFDVDCPQVPPPWSHWTFWQSGKSHVNGVVASQADLDLFDGTSTQLLSFVTARTP